MGRTARRLKHRRAVELSTLPLASVQPNIERQIDLAVAALDHREIEQIINRIPIRSPDGVDLSRGIQLKSSMSTYAALAILKYFRESWNSGPVHLMERLNQIWDLATTTTERGLAATAFVSESLQASFLTGSPEDSSFERLRQNCLEYWSTVLLAKGRNFQLAGIGRPWAAAFEAVVQRIPSCLQIADGQPSVAQEVRMKAVEIAGRAVARSIDTFSGWQEIAVRGLVRKDLNLSELACCVDLDEIFDFSMTVAAEFERRMQMN
jgi:hypothetical protein